MDPDKNLLKPKLTVEYIDQSIKKNAINSQTLDGWSNSNSSNWTISWGSTYPVVKKEEIMFNKGDRVVVKEGYVGAGKTYIYQGKSTHFAGEISVKTIQGRTTTILIECIEAKPYTKKEIARNFAVKYGLNKKAEKALRKIF